MAELESQIKQFIVDTFLFDASPDDIDPEVSFMGTGTIDSLGVLELISFTEDQFGIAVADEDVVPENFDSVRNLANYIRSTQHSAVALPA